MRANEAAQYGKWEKFNLFMRFPGIDAVSEVGCIAVQLAERREQTEADVLRLAYGPDMEEIGEELREAISTRSLSRYELQVAGDLFKAVNRNFTRATKQSGSVSSKPAVLEVAHQEVLRYYQIYEDLPGDFGDRLPSFLSFLCLAYMFDQESQPAAGR